MAAPGITEPAAPVVGAEVTNWKIVSPYKIYFRHALNSSIPLTLTYSVMHGYGEARKAFPHPKHIPMQVAWNNAKNNIKRGAAPIIGTMVIFNMARGHWEQNHYTRTQMDFKPMLYGLCFASVPFVASVLMRKPNLYAGSAVAFCMLDYAFDRWNSKPVNSSTWSR